LQGSILSGLGRTHHHPIVSLSTGTTHKANTKSARKSKKRRPSEPIVKHSSNKRKRIGLDTIPEDAKAAMFNAIPNQVKADLFSNVLKTAFPNFNNLMMASWNVVSIYSNVGTDFPELHTAIVDLNSVLQDFEESLGVKLSRKEPKFRQDFALPSHDSADDVREGRSAQPTSDAMQHDDGEEPSVAPHDDEDVGIQQQEDIDALLNEPEPSPKSESPEMQPPPRMMEHNQTFYVEEEEEDRMPPHSRTIDYDQTSDAQEEGAEEEGDQEYISPSSPRPTTLLPPIPHQYHQTFDAEAEEDEEGNQEHTLPSSPQPTTLLPPMPHQLTNLNPSQTTHSPSPSHTLASLHRPKGAELLRRREAYRRSSSFAVQSSSTQPDDGDTYSAAKDEDQQLKSQSLAEMSTSDLRATYKARKTKLIQMFGGNANVPQQYRVQMSGLMSEIKERQRIEGEMEEREREDVDGAKVGGEMAMPSFLGNSVLGGKTTGTGMAPVAPMVRLRKDGGGSGGAGGIGIGDGRNGSGSVSRWKGEH
jgi:hypothetical protein